MVLDFVDENGNDVSTDEDRMFVDLNGYSYKDRTGRKILIQGAGMRTSMAMKWNRIP